MGSTCSTATKKVKNNIRKYEDFRVTLAAKQPDGTFHPLYEQEYDFSDLFDLKADVLKIIHP